MRSRHFTSTGSITTFEDKPMDFSFSDQHKMIERMVYDFARKEIMPVIKEHDRHHTFPAELLPKMAELGFLGICLPVRYGGAGLDYLSLGIISEGLEYADSSVRETIAVHLGLHAMPIFQWGTRSRSGFSAAAGDAASVSPALG
jgi:glutaryl-CoA dehydrogenase (non-decarboxylating)